MIPPTHCPICNSNIVDTYDACGYATLECGNNRCYFRISYTDNQFKSFHFEISKHIISLFGSIHLYKGIRTLIWSCSQEKQVFTSPHYVIFDFTSKNTLENQLNLILTYS